MVLGGSLHWIFQVPSWMHIGYKNSEGKQRKQLLSMIGGKYYPMT